MTINCNSWAKNGGKEFFGMDANLIHEIVEEHFD
jgi:hypothetical protein